MYIYAAGIAGIFPSCHSFELFRQKAYCVQPPGQVDLLGEVQGRFAYARELSRADG
jgi:hypothetical protein